MERGSGGLRAAVPAPPPCPTDLCGRQSEPCAERSRSQAVPNQGLFFFFLGGLKFGIFINSAVPVTQRERLRGFLGAAQVLHPSGHPEKLRVSTLGTPPGTCPGFPVRPLLYSARHFTSFPGSHAVFFLDLPQCFVSCLALFLMQF